MQAAAAVLGAAGRCRSRLAMDKLQAELLCYVAAPESKVAQCACLQALATHWVAACRLRQVMLAWVWAGQLP